MAIKVGDRGRGKIELEGVKVGGMLEAYLYITHNYIKGPSILEKLGLSGSEVIKFQAYCKCCCVLLADWLYNLLMNFYNISQAASRLQTAQHYHSSLEQPTLDNVEAQLQVARQRNYELALSYFQNKYGTGEAYNQYIASNGLQGLGPPKQQEFDLRRELQKQAEEIRQRQLKKMQEKKQGIVIEDDEEGQLPGASRVGARKNKNRPNPWEQGSSKQEKKQQAPAKETVRVQQQFYEINVPREKEGAFISQFKNYLANKKKPKQPEPQPQASPQKTLTQSFNLSQLKNASSLSQNKSRADAPKYQQELVKKIMKDIAGKCQPSTKIEKVQLIEYLTANPKISRVLGVPQEDLAKSIIGLSSKDPNLLSFSEVLLWVLGALGKSDEAKRIKAAQQYEQVPQGCMLSKDLLGLFEETFRSMDRHNDLIIKRAPFLARLTNDPLVKRSLNLPAVFEPQYNRHVSLRRIFQRLQIQALLCSQEQRKLNEYISWSQFMGHFQSGHRSRGKYDLIVLLQSLRNQQKFGLSHLPESVFQIINWGIKRADRGQELLSTVEILNEIKMHRDYEIQKFTFLRSAEDDGTSETFEDILVRVKEKAMKFVTPKEFLEYFSIRGKPIEDFQRERTDQQAKNLSAVKVTFIQNELFSKADQPNGYDSDPETYNNSAIHEKPQDPRKSQKEFKRFKATAQSFIEPEQQQTSQYHGQTGNRQFKLTVPQPFSFEQREKERKANRAAQSPTRPKSPGFKAAPVPDSVMEVGLYERMLQQQRKKNEQRKKCSMIMTLANEKPFSFESRKTNKKTKEERQDFVFKAKPIPWFCSVDLLKKKQQEEILRNERIAKVAQENLAKAKLPPRMEKDFLQKEAKKMQDHNVNKRPASSQPRVKEPPNFDRLHKEFQEALQRKRKENKTTQVCQFKFATTNPKAPSKIVSDKAQEPPKRGQVPLSMKSNIDIFAQSTAKFTQQVERRRQEAEAKRKQQAKRKRQEAQRSRIDEQLKAKVQEAAKKNRQNKEKQQAEKRKEENAKNQQIFQSWKKECVQKGRQQPLLIDRVSKRDQKIEKMKRLYEISQTLISNGIKGKQHDHYFKREELLMLQDYKELKGKL